MRQDLGSPGPWFNLAWPPRDPAHVLFSPTIVEETPVLRCTSPSSRPRARSPTPSRPRPEVARVSGSVVPVSPVPLSYRLPSRLRSARPLHTRACVRVCGPHSFCLTEACLIWPPRYSLTWTAGARISPHAQVASRTRLVQCSPPRNRMPAVMLPRHNPPMQRRPRRVPAPPPVPRLRHPPVTPVQTPPARRH